jgi:hypothetical protein
MKTPTWKVVMFPAGRTFDHMGAVFKTLTVEAHTGMAAEEEALAMWGPKWQICSVKRLTGYSNIPVEARNNDTHSRNF